MPLGTSSRPEQLYTKRRFVQVNNNEEKLVRLVRKDEHTRASRHPQRLIRLIPVVASISDKYRAIVDRLIREKLIPPTRDEIHVERSNIYEKTQSNDVRQRSKPHSSDAALNAVNESLTLLLNGQQRIGSRIDSLKREQEVNKQRLEEALKTVIDELKAEMVGKSQEQSEKLEKLRLKQDHLYDDVNLLNLRLDEMELLVSKLMRETEPAEILLRVPETNKPATIEEVFEDEESLHSVLSISSGSLAEGPEGPVKKTRKPSQAFIYTQSTPETAVKKDTKPDPVEIIHF
uniref:Dystrobrevin alpha n=1 Tax=Haemonchus contortus TaxID=6289 RepID=A0A7I4Z2T0_HAECO